MMCILSDISPHSQPKRMSNKTIQGFSKLSKSDKQQWIAQQFSKDPDAFVQTLASFQHADEQVQRVLDGFSENTVSNFIMPYGIAPNFLVNDRWYSVPMVIEESSVVAAASSAAKFWSTRGGFNCTIVDTLKVGQVHFTWNGNYTQLVGLFPELKTALLREAQTLTANMEKRGGGVTDIRLINFSDVEPGYFQLSVHFQTCDSMGANFINSVLESFGQTLTSFIESHPSLSDDERDVSVIMAILSNYTPECLVRAEVSCPIADLKGVCDDLDAAAFAKKFNQAVKIAHIDPYRATTHNKGIYNGIDAVVLATGNDFRAIEAAGHTFASRSGQYRSLSYCSLEGDTFRFWLEVPLAVGTIGGLTRLHPLAGKSLELLGDPSAEELMMIIAATGLAQNFAALKSLVTTGIQKGHMKMHLMNILHHLEAQPEEIVQATLYFENKAISFNAVRDYLQQERKAKKAVG